MNPCLLCVFSLFPKIVACSVEKNPCLFGFPCFFSCVDVLVFLVCLFLHFQGFCGFCREENPCFFWSSLLALSFPYRSPLPDPTPTPANSPKRTRNGPETDPKRSQTEPNGPDTEPKRSRNGPKSSFLGWDGRWVCRDGGGGVVREKENH